MTTGPTDVKVTTAAGGPGGMPLALKFNEGLGPLVPERAAFADVCAMLPEGASWGDPLTPQIAREIVEAAVAAERERCADPLPAAAVRKIKDVCDSIGLDVVAFAWRV